MQEQFPPLVREPLADLVILNGNRHLIHALALLLQYHVKQFTRFCWWSKRSAIYSLQYGYEHFLEPVNLAGQLKHLNNEQTVVDKQWYYTQTCKSTPVLLYKHLGLRTTNNSC